MTDDEKVEALLDEQVKIMDEISELTDRNWGVTIKLCQIKGSCPLCSNTHYPHCGNGDSNG